MTRRMRYSTTAVGTTLLIAGLALAPQAHADRVSNSLSQCIAKADLIVAGSVDVKADRGDGGIVEVSFKGGVLKGQVDGEIMTITDPYFRATYQRISIDGPPVI